MNLSEVPICGAVAIMSTACTNCHDKYREVPGGVAGRC
ncbi:MAG: hypothetical protein EXQ53_11360 [Acidobacteria bacterium]|nr:hypothetical protein [Acidobacteriota bacterium]